MPSYLGGSGDFLRCFEEHPYAKHAPQLKEYLLITSGYHVAGFITHFMGPRKNDFVEMGLHHIVALYLFGGAYIFNGWEAGSVLAFLHDLADIATNMVKFLSESKFKTAAGIWFVSVFMPVWFYTRCLALPYMIYLLGLMPVDFHSWIVMPGF